MFERVVVVDKYKNVIFEEIFDTFFDKSILDELLLLSQDRCAKVFRYSIF